jgi:poly-gamma-glutamate capsule biosynthesis protein CapA/YwtB (metallophosphatase superfamily)
MFPKTKLTLLLTTLFLTIGCAGVQKTVQQEPVPASTPIPVAVTPSDKTITMAFVGDIMMGGSAAYKLKTEGPDSFFTNSVTLIKQADIAMGNLEGPLGPKDTGKIWIKKKYTFLVDPSSATGLAHAGFKLLTLANNHTMDFGVTALQSTLDALEKNGLKHAGAGTNLAAAREPAWFELKGKKVAVLAYSLTEPSQFWATNDRAGCAPADGILMKDDIQAARAKGADLVFVCCHWGQEKHTRLRYYQPTLAHLAIEAGADAVVGHHPHIWQNLEVYQGKPIAYAIGNFCFGTLTGIKDSGILYLTFDEKNHWTGGKIIPMNVYNYQTHFDTTPAKEKQAKTFFAYLKKGSKTANLSQEGSEITWKAPDVVVTPTPSPAPLPTPTPILTPIPTPIPEAGENSEGAVPGAQSPKK